MSLAFESPHLQSAALLTQAGSALPLSEAYAEILPHGLLRGQVVVCHGVAAYSIALGLVERAVTVGSWLAVVDLEVRYKGSITAKPQLQVFITRRFNNFLKSAEKKMQNLGVHAYLK